MQQTTSRQQDSSNLHTGSKQHDRSRRQTTSRQQATMKPVRISNPVDSPYDLFNSNAHHHTKLYIERVDTKKGKAYSSICFPPVLSNWNDGGNLLDQCFGHGGGPVKGPVTLAMPKKACNPTEGTLIHSNKPHLTEATQGHATHLGRGSWKLRRFLHFL